MKGHDHQTQDVLDAWIGGETPLERPADEADDDALLALLVGARRAAPRLSEAEAAGVFSAVRRRTRAAQSRRRLLSWAAAAAVLVAALALAPWHRPAQQERVIVRQMRFQAEHNGKVVRLEMIVSRVEARRGRGGRDVAKPSL